MMRKPYASLFLALAAILLAGSLCLAAEAAPSEEHSVGSDTPTVFYFHGKKRCATCRAIESAADTVVHQRFARQLKRGALAWKVVNFDEKSNAHYVKELSLVGAGVVIARVTPEGELRGAKTLQKVWLLSRDEKRMQAYLTEEIASFLGKDA